MLKKIKVVSMLLCCSLLFVGCIQSSEGMVYS